MTKTETRNRCHVAQSTETRVRVVLAAREVLAEMADVLKDSGGCDHSVGICWCDFIRKADELKAAVEVLSPKSIIATWSPTKETIK